MKYLKRRYQQEEAMAWFQMVRIVFGNQKPRNVKLVIFRGSPRSILICRKTGYMNSVITGQIINFIIIVQLVNEK